MALQWHDPAEDVTDDARVRVFGRLADAWRLSVAQRAALLDSNHRTYHRWKRDPQVARLSADQRTRIAYLVRIYVDLHAIFGDGGDANAWVHRPNAAYGGEPPLSELVDGGMAELLRVAAEVALAAGS